MGDIQDSLEEIKNTLKENKKTTRKFRLPFKGKVSMRGMREGYATIVKINENKNIDFLREKIVDGTVKLEDTIHAINPNDIFFYKGKPLIFQCKNKINPYNPLKDKHETYGQKYIMARMESDRISGKKKIGWGLSIGLVIIVGIVIYAMVTGS